MKMVKKVCEEAITVKGNDWWQTDVVGSYCGSIPLFAFVASTCIIMIGQGLMYEYKTATVSETVCLVFFICSMCVRKWKLLWYEFIILINISRQDQG